MDLQYKLEFARQEAEQEMQAEIAKAQYKMAVESIPAAIEAAAEDTARKSSFTSKEALINELKHQIASSRAKALAALVKVYNNQTSDEQSKMATVEDNGVGFSGTDAEFLTSLAQKYLQYKTLSDKQMQWVFKKMPKYARQLVEGSLAEGKIFKKEGYYYFR